MLKGFRLPLNIGILFCLMLAGNGTWNAHFAVHPFDLVHFPDSFCCLSFLVSPRMANGLLKERKREREKEPCLFNVFPGGACGAARHGGPGSAAGAGHGGLGQRGAIPGLRCLAGGGEDVSHDLEKALGEAAKALEAAESYDLRHLQAQPIQALRFEHLHQSSHSRHWSHVLLVPQI